MLLRSATTALLALSLLACAAESSGDDEEAAVVPAPVRLAADSLGGVIVRLDTAERRRLDLLTVPLSEARWGGSRELAGELVADPSAVSYVRAGVSGRLDATAWPAFGARVREGQELGTVGDARALVAARDGQVTAVLAQPTELVQAGQPLLELTNYDRPIARLVWFGESGPRPPRDVRLTLEGSPPVPARLIGEAAEADPTTRRPAFLYRADHAWPGARSGLPVVASFGGGFDQLVGVRVPVEAVVQWDGFAWVYIESAPRQYVRRRIDTDRPLEGAWFVGLGLAVGDGVVVRGAQALLSEEFRARISVGDESDK